MICTWLFLKQLASFLTLSIFLTIPGSSNPGIGAPVTNNNILPPPQQEIKMAGIYLGYQNELIQLTIEDKLLSFPVSPQATIALVGKHCGRILPLEDFPNYIPVEIVIDNTGTIKSMRSKPEENPVVPGTSLNESGYNATLSPSEQYYTLYHSLDGLFLYEMFNPAQEAPLFLSAEPLCAWNKDGTKLAFTSPEHIEILPMKARQTRLNKKQSIPLYPPVATSSDQHIMETMRVVTSLQWSPDDQHLLASYLEDYPNQGSECFQIVVFRPNGHEAGKITVENLGGCCWLSEKTILLIINAEETSPGNGFIWNWENGETKELALQHQGICSNLCYDPASMTVAYTITTDFIDQLFVRSLAELSLPEAVASPLEERPYPLRHLQWSKDGCLFYWDEINNTIIQANRNGKIIAKFSGYLPAYSVAARFLYFTEEPVTEPLPLYLSPKINPGR